MTYLGEEFRLLAPLGIPYFLPHVRHMTYLGKGFRLLAPLGIGVPIPYFLFPKICPINER